MSKVSQAEVESLQRAFGTSLNGFGNKSALLIIDMMYSFADGSYCFGDDSGEQCAANIRSLLDIAREKQIPVIYTKGEWRENKIERGLWKTSPERDKQMREDPKAHLIVPELEPLPTEPVIIKSSPSGFHCTNMINLLVQSNVDTVIVTGMVTSGCVYATAVDAFSYGFRVIIPEEAVADRSPSSHEVALLNIHMKYGDVMKIDEVKKAMRAF